MSSLQGSPVSRSVSQVSASEQMTLDGFGPTLPASFATLDLASSSWRMSPASSRKASTKSSFRWPRWGSMRNGECLAAPVWAPVTDVSDGSAWVTPTASTGGGTYGNGQPKLKGQVSTWPTPKARDHHPAGLKAAALRDSPDLPYVAVTWPTPTARDWKSGKSNITANARPLSEVVERCGPQAPTPSGATSMQRSGRLNSRFVEWLMGFPADWSRNENSDLWRWATLCRHLLPQWLGES